MKVTSDLLPPLGVPNMYTQDLMTGSLGAGHRGKWVTRNQYKSFVSTDTGSGWYHRHKATISRS